MISHLTSQLLIVSFDGALAAAAPVRPSDRPAFPEAYQQLVSVRFFAFGGVGFAGTTSDAEKAFHAPAASTNALELFTAVLAHGNTEARLYALCGIRRLAPEKFEVLSRSVADGDLKVATMAGCEVMEELASSVAARIAAGRYDIYTGPKVKTAN